MTYIRFCRSVVALFVVLLLGLCACGGGGEEPESDPFLEALKFAPASTTQFNFTDWQLIRQYTGAGELTGQSNQEERGAFIKALNETQAITTQYSNMTLLFSDEHAATWGWDTLDLVWEADVTRVHVLKFPQGFDLAPLEALFQERGFEQSEYAGARLYSYTGRPDTQDWFRPQYDPLLNSAILEGEGILVCAHSMEHIQQVLDAHAAQEGTLADDPAVKSIRERLGTVAAAILMPGSETCQRPEASTWLRFMHPETNPAELTEAKIDAFVETEGIPTLNPYTFFGVGYRYEAEKPVARLVLHYDQAATAQADLEVRRGLLEEGTSLRTRRPYRESCFTVESAAVEESDLVVKLRPYADRPRFAFDPVWTSDLVFAACP